MKATRPVCPITSSGGVVSFRADHESEGAPHCWRRKSARSRAPRATDHRLRVLLSLVTVSVGAYLTVLSFSGQIYSVFLGYNPTPFLGLYLVLQVLIALAVLSLGWGFAPTSVPRRALAIGLTIGLVVFSVTIAIVRISGTLRVPGALFMQFTVGNVPFMIVVAVALGWLIVRERSPIAFVFVLLAGVIPIAQYALLLAGTESILTQLLMLMLSAAVLVSIAWMGRGVSGSSAD